jgi:RNA polymerase sigma factor (sigma-70 family)
MGEAVLAPDLFAQSAEPESFWLDLQRQLQPMVRARLPGRPAEVEEVIAETFLNLVEIRAQGRYDPGRGSAAALARSIAERRCHDRLRRRYRRPEVSLEELNEADPGPAPELRAIEAESMRSWREALQDAFQELQREDALSGSRRALAVFLRYRFAIAEDDYRFLFQARIPGMELPSWRDVAGRLGISEDAARQLGSRGLRALSQALSSTKLGENQV